MGVSRAPFSLLRVPYAFGSPLPGIPWVREFRGSSCLPVVLPSVVPGGTHSC